MQSSNPPGPSFDELPYRRLLDAATEVVIALLDLEGRIAYINGASRWLLGYSPEEMLGLLNSLSLSQIYAALAYALANPEEIQESLRAEDDTARQLSPEHNLA